MDPDGHAPVAAAWWVAKNIGEEIAWQLAENGGNFDCVNWGHVAAAAVLGRFAKGAWKSTKRFGHTFTRHGAGAKNFQSLLDRAKTRGQSPKQGQWLDNDKAADYLQSLRVDGPATMRLPPGLGQVIHKDGTVTAAEWARVAPRPGGGFSSAFPFAP